MEIEEIYEYIITNFEGKRLHDIILNKEDKKILEISDKIKNGVKDLDDKKYNNLIEMLSKNFMEQIVKGSRNLKLTKHDVEHILIIYEELLDDILNEELSMIQISKNHFERIKNYISDIGKDKCECGHNHEHVEIVGYSPEFILGILGVDEKEIKGKELDIGCTKNADLVKYLRSKNIEAYGIDIDVEENEFLENEDWLEKDFGKEEYDMVFSNIAFTKHFLRNHLSDEGEYMDYATTFMRILESLKIGGKFFYVPSVEFIEELLPEDKYEVVNEFIDDDNMRTVITRIK